MKRIILTVAVLFIILCGIAVAEETTIVASGACGIDGSNVTWTLDSEGTLTISGEGEMEDYSIYSPDLSPWFSNYSSIENVMIGEGVTTIGEAAFYHCSNLSSVNISTGVTSIGNYAFGKCSSLSDIELPESVVFIGEVAFGNCTSLKIIELPDGVTTIGEAAFSECSSLTEIVIPEGVTMIHNSAFCGCIGLRTVTLPESITTFGNKVFEDCTILTAKVYRGSAAHSYCESNGIPYVFINPDFTVENGVLTAWTGSDTDLVIPSDLGITSIGDEVFIGKVNLKSVVIPEGVTSIGVGVFQDCSALTTIGFPAGLTYIGSHAFENCDSLKSITLPEGLTTVRIACFYDCDALETVNLPSTVTEIYAAFTGCTALKSINIPDSVTCIGAYAFERCSSLSAIDIPDSVTVIEECVFSDCTSLNRITLPNNLTRISDHMFANCTSLSSITLPEGVTSIDSCAFRDCSSLSSITIPAGVTSIGDSAFEGCDNLRSMIFRGNNLPSIGTDAIPSSVTIYCHKGSEVDEWATNSGYTCVYLEDHTHIPVIDPAVPATHVTTGCTEGSHCEICGEVLVAQQIIPVVEVKKLVLPAKLEVIEAEAFAGGTFACVVLPDGCKAIRAGAFRDCAQLRFIEIPTSVTSIDSSAFDGCGKGLIIVTVSGSEAERFADAQGITCVLR